MTRIALPPYFYRDHEERDLPTGTIVGHEGARVLVEANDEEWAEILSDARYYSDPYGPDLQPRGLKHSAALTVQAIEAARPDLAKRR